LGSRPRTSAGPRGPGRLSVAPDQRDVDHGGLVDDQRLRILSERKLGQIWKLRKKQARSAAANRQRLAPLARCKLPQISSLRPGNTASSSLTGSGAHQRSICENRERIVSKPPRSPGPSRRVGSKEAAGKGWLARLGAAGPHRQQGPAPQSSVIGLHVQGR
jgi:hypothetical protein